MLQSENWHENHEYAPLKGPLTKNKNRIKRFQIVQHTILTSTHAKKLPKKVSIPLDKLTFLQQVWSISGEIRASTRKPHWLLG